ncbi:unnamed protein product [Symbiodinium sp. KB8]|nr:unnamed protein product [Symbiodinium sp. KB8]
MEANAPKSRAKTNVDPEDLDRQVRVSRNVEEHELENALRPMPQHGAKMKELLLRLFNLEDPETAAPRTRVVPLTGYTVLVPLDRPAVGENAEQETDDRTFGIVQYDKEAPLKTMAFVFPKQDPNGSLECTLERRLATGEAPRKSARIDPAEKKLTMKEMNSMKKFEVCDEVKIEDCTGEQINAALDCRWVKVWKGENELICRGVVRGCVQNVEKSGEEANLSASTPLLVTMRLLLCMAMARNWGITLGDASTAFLHAAMSGKCLWKLKKAMYGLRQQVQKLILVPVSASVFDANENVEPIAFIAFLRSKLGAVRKGPGAGSGVSPIISPPTNGVGLEITTGVWWWQKGFSELILEVFLGLCVMTAVICVLTEMFQHDVTCHERLSNDGRRLAPNCIRQVGVNQTCGVDGCFCGMLSDLLCDEPPLPAEICIKVVRPLCAAAGTNVRTSGMHGHLHNILVASIVLSVINFVNWVITAWAMLLNWLGYQMRNSQVINKPVEPNTQYHRFTVLFESPTEESLVFNVDSSEDPEAVACTLAGFDET